jgi:GT2 family glycosyltransferase
MASSQVHDGDTTSLSRNITADFTPISALVEAPLKETDEDPVVIPIIVTYNRLDKLRATVAAYAGEAVDGLVIVDNASCDGTADWIRRHMGEHPTHRAIHLVENLGGAGGFEAGMRWVDEQGHGRGWVVLHDDDAFPAPGVTSEFRRRLAHGFYEDHVGVAAAVVTPAGEPADINRPILNIFRHPLESWRHVKGTVANFRDLYHVPNRDILNVKASYRVDAASFVGLYLNLEKLPAEPKARYPDGDLFIYGDDTIYTARLASRGASILYDGAVRYIHDTGTGYEQGVLLPEWKHYYISRNSWQVYWVISPWAGGSLYLLALVMRMRKIFDYRDPLLRRRSFRAYWLGVMDVLRRRRRSHRHVVNLVEGSN